MRTESGSEGCSGFEDTLGRERESAQKGKRGIQNKVM